MTGLRSLLALGIAGALALSACGADTEELSDTDVEFADDEFADDEFADDEFADDEFADETEQILAELQEGGFCDPADVEDLGEVTAMHFVVGGQIQPPCFVDGGVENDPRLLDAWESMTSITPTSLVSDVSLLAGFEACATCDTLAFVSALDEQGSFFLMAVDVVAGDADPDELRLTMQHELAHVFSQVPDEQLIVGDDGECATYFNGSGCFVEGSYVDQWIDQFWTAEMLAELPDDGSPNDDEVAGERCSLDPAFTGSYGATHPEEDFAETYSAYVFGVTLDEAMDDKLAFFDQFPEFAEVRDNAAAAGLVDIPNNFDGCGF
ncbi:MAG: hypothetical protein ACE37B_17070 [Ilumatobacter sp.]|uniref:hypothetical protein n=1 Tax=Ilumatobacter sp. TaxID=1967498 RepID=UPI003918F938